MLKTENIYVLTTLEKLNKFNVLTHANIFDEQEREIILTTVLNGVQLDNLRRNAFNFSYIEKVFNKDEETEVSLPKCIAHINVLINDGKFELFIVFRSLHYDNNFEFDMTTIKLLAQQIQQKFNLLCDSIMIAFNSIHTERDIDLEHEISSSL